MPHKKKGKEETEGEAHGPPKPSDVPPGPGQEEDGKDQSRARERVLMKMMEGWCPFEELPQQSKNVVRIFVSSTFSDTKEERNAFMERVYPKLADLCRNKYGLEFQVVDMRWGVPEEASQNHSTTELCLNEIHKCQELSAGPNFVAILGNKYGYRPIPNTIPKDEFEILQSTAETGSDVRWNTVSEWFCLDTNSQPPVYLLQPIALKLQHYNDTTNQELRKKAQTQWNTTDILLTSCLRETAESAHKQGTLSDAQKHKYFMSVTENEVTHGMLGGRTPIEESCVCIIREIPNIKSHIVETKAPKFIDINQADKQVDVEAEQFLQTLRESRVVTKLPDSNMTRVEIDWDASGASVSVDSLKNDPSLQSQTSMNKHLHYLNNLCSEYLEKLSRLVKTAGEKQKTLFNDTNTEALEHWHFAKIRCEVFEGREDVISQVKRYISMKTNYPLVIYGKSGCGKTSIVAKCVQEISNAICRKGQSAKMPLRLCFRFLGTTPYTSDVQQLLVSLCKQLSITCDTTWEEPDKYPDLVKSFHMLLDDIANRYRLILILDSVDQLLPAYDAYKVTWLPKTLHKNIKLIVSALNEGYTIVSKLEDIYPSNNSNFVEVKPLTKDVGIRIVYRWLNKCDRSMSEQQENVVRAALEICGLPLFARIMFDQVKKWKSYETYDVGQLETSIQGAINKLYEQMEVTFGVSLVKHCLSYLTSSRYGLSEVELEHILSLDDLLLNTVFRYWRPPIRRIPALLWTRIRSEINSYIVERSADGVLVLNWYHRQFITATKDRYLTDGTFTKYIHQIMSEYFDGVWGGGRAKPFQYDGHHVRRFGLKTAESKEDRKVPLQPYTIKDSTDDESCVRYNHRKVSELPFHLLQTNNMESLKKAVFFNLEWMYSKAKGSSPKALIQEFELFMTLHKPIGDDITYQILYATLQLIRPYIVKYPESLPYELSGRLAKYIGKYDIIRVLVQSCDVEGIRYCPVTPVYTCFDSAHLGLKQTLTTSQSEPWHDGGCICCTPDFKTMYSITYNETAEPFLSSWDVEAGSRTQRQAIVKPNKNHSTIDSYFQCMLHNSENFIVGLYRQKYFRFEGVTKARFARNGYIDIITISDGSVLRTFEDNLANRDFHNSVYFLRGDWIAVWFGIDIPLRHLFEDIRHPHSRPHMMTNDCTKTINKCSRRTGIKSYVGEERTITKTRTKSVQIKLFKKESNSKDYVGEFENSDSVSGIAVTNDDKTAILGVFIGEISVYDITRLGEGKFLKVKRKMNLPRMERVLVIDMTGVDADSSSDGELSSDEEQKQRKPRKSKPINFRMTMSVSPDDKHMVSVHQSPMAWEAFLWSLAKSQFVGRIAENMPLDMKYPAFSADSQFVLTHTEKSVHVYSCVNGSQVKSFDVSSKIKDLCMSPADNQVAVMLGREIIFLDIGSPEEASKTAKKTTKQCDTGIVDFLSRDRVSNMTTLKSVTATQTADGMTFEDVSDPAENVTKGLLTTDNGQDSVALDVRFSPDGTTVVELFSRVQVVDMSSRTIKYTPFKRDLFFHSPSRANATDGNAQVGDFANMSGFDVFQCPGISLPMQLCVGDKILGGNGRVRFRVSDENEKLQLMRIPSHITSRTVTENKLQLNFGISVYEESVLEVSNNYFVTLKRKGTEEFVCVYSMDQGKLLTTHAIPGGVGQVVISEDESRLLATGPELILYQYSGDKFAHAQGRCFLKDNNHGDNIYEVKEMMTFPASPHALVIKYSEDNRESVLNQHVYRYVNVIEKRVSPAIVAKMPFEDVSSDGTEAIDSHLVLHNLVEGTVAQRIPYASASVNMSVQARIGEDKTYIAFVDKFDDTLNIVKKMGDGYQPLTTCKAHVPHLPPYGGFHLRQEGRVISLKTNTGRMLLVIRDAADHLSDKLSHENELMRAQSLVVSVRVSDRLTEKPEPETQATTTSVDQEQPESNVVIEDFLAHLSLESHTGSH